MTRAQTRILAEDPLGGTVRRTVLPSGLRILTEAVPAMRSVSFGVWVGVGSRDETRQLSGVSHFLEHLLFKGTRRRSALDISAAIEAVGGETNAFTTKEYTCYYARVLDADLPLAIDVMCDLVVDSVLAEADVETSGESSSKRSPCTTTSRAMRSTTCSPRRCTATTRWAG
jgi:predicted Zn-dependent peptidase